MLKLFAKQNTKVEKTRGAAQKIGHVFSPILVYPLTLTSHTVTRNLPLRDVIPPFFLNSNNWKLAYNSYVDMGELS